MNDIFTVIVDKRLIQAVEYVKHRAGSRPEEIWKNVARYMNGLTPEQCSERYNYLVTEKQYAPLDYRPKVPMPDEELRDHHRRGQEGDDEYSQGLVSQ